MSADLKTKSTVVVIGGHAGMKASIAHMLSEIDKVLVVERAIKPVHYVLTALPRINDVLINIKKDGDYRQFEKRDKRKNFRR